MHIYWDRTAIAEKALSQSGQKNSTDSGPDSG